MPYCTRCGFNWNTLGDAAEALNLKLSQLTDNDLWNILTFFNCRLKGFISEVATANEVALSSVGKVMMGKVRSANMKARIIEAFRKRIAMGEPDVSLYDLAEQSQGVPAIPPSNP